MVGSAGELGVAPWIKTGDSEREQRLENREDV